MFRVLYQAVVFGLGMLILGVFIPDVVVGIISIALKLIAVINLMLDQVIAGLAL